MQTTATKQLTPFHGDYDDFRDFAVKSEWLLLTCVSAGDKGIETWLTPSGRIIRITRDRRSVLSAA